MLSLFAFTLALASGFSSLEFVGCSDEEDVTSEGPCGVFETFEATEVGRRSVEVGRGGTEVGRGGVEVGRVGSSIVVAAGGLAPSVPGVAGRDISYWALLPTHQNGES